MNTICPLPLTKDVESFALTISDSKPNLMFNVLYHPSFYEMLDVPKEIFPLLVYSNNKLLLPMIQSCLDVYEAKLITNCLIKRLLHQKETNSLNFWSRLYERKLIVQLTIIAMMQRGWY